MENTRPDANEARAKGSEGYLPIGDYALVGDCRSAALVSRLGSIDWLCLPHFSSPATFAALLDRRRGGRFALRPTAAFEVNRRYLPQTNVLETTFRTQSGTLQLTDCLPIVNDAERTQQLQPQREVLRLVSCVEGEVELEVVFEPRPDFGHRRARLKRRGRLGWTCQGGSEILMLHTDLPLDDGDGTGLCSRCRLRAGECGALSLTYARHDIGVILPLGEHARERCHDTVQWWRRWCARSVYDGPYPEMVERSALTLKMLTYGLSGALIAAPTTSLPEVDRGVRNWDYRYCWPRDAALTLSAFLELGHRGEADAFLGWLLHATRLSWPRLQVLYDVYGETRVHERELSHLEGYRGASPVRVGNEASDQRQLDVYGEVIAAAHDHVAHGGHLDADEARLLRGFAEQVCRKWRLGDQGIWEDRDAGRHHTHSKVMCWVALDRIVRMGQQGHLRVPLERYGPERDAIRKSIEANGFNEEQGTYVSVYGGDDVDASLLLMALYGYQPADAPRMLATYRRIENELGRNGFLYRFPREYDSGFLPPGENAFVIASFWAVEYLALLGEREQARTRFERIVACANDLGLLAEEVDPADGRLYGNFPQAFSHLGLIVAAHALAGAPAVRGRAPESPARER